MTQPLVQSILLALALIASLALFVTLKQEIQTHARKNRRRMEEMSAKLGEASGPRTPEAVAVTPPARSGFNLNRRTQAIRLLRRGENVSHIAAVLGVPQREIELLIRVRRIVAGPKASAAEPIAAAR
jgi:hypothetical protein